MTNLAAGEDASDTTSRPRKAQISGKPLQEVLHIMKDSKPPLKPDTVDHQEPATRYRGEDVHK